jgi:hypothetical protein
MELNLLSVITRIYFTKSFDEKYKDEIVEKLIKKCNINGMKSDCSFEGGINLPLTQEWFQLKPKLQNKQYLDYHNSRQFRFISEQGKIIGMRCKDEINYITKDEMIKIKNSMEEIICYYL